jgi:hypothetical protein
MERRMSQATAYAAETEPIDPAKLYPYAAFIRVSGCSKTRICMARRDGILLPIRKVGRRGYVLGRDGIDFLLQLAAAQEERELAAAE